MGFQVKPTNLSGGIFSYLSRYPVKRDIRFRYNTSIFVQPQNHFESKEIIENMHTMKMHPGNYDWKNMVSYGGAIYSALRKVDRSIVNSTFPNIPENLNITVEAPISWGGTLFKTAASIYLMTKGLPISEMFIFDTKTDFWKTFVYLGLNAIRNAVSDLSSKHGFDFSEWKNNLHHIKLDKLTDSMVVTAFCFPILYAIKESLHNTYAGSDIEPYITSATICIVDAAMQYISRKLRGFDKSVALKDTFRPFVGDFGALFLSLASSTIMNNSFLYLLSRKLFAETYSGYIEAKAKRMEKENERKESLDRVLDISKYVLPEEMRYAMAGINLVYLTSVKSVTKWIYSEILSKKRFGDENLYLNLIKIHKAIKNDTLIKETAKFILPFDEWRSYQNQLISDFEINREMYYSKYFRKFMSMVNHSYSHLQDKIY